jgi:O-antigen ligase
VHTLLVTILAIVCLELAVVIAQSLGSTAFPQEAQAEIWEGYRANGTFAHPGSLGKYLLLLIALVLPELRSPVRTLRRLAVSIIALAAPCLVLTASRTNALAYVVALLLWTLLLPNRQNWIKKLSVPVLVGGGIIATSSVWIERIRRGEDGSFRAELTEAALAQIERAPFLGVGPNSYVDSVGRYDHLAAIGWPVHNVFLHMTVEVGLIGAALFFAPHVYVLVASARSWWQHGRDSRYGQAVLATFPAIVAISLTGWGMLTESLPLWLFVLAYSVAKQQRVSDEAAASHALGIHDPGATTEHPGMQSGGEEPLDRRRTRERDGVPGRQLIR